MPLTEEQIELRKTGIGASEAAAAIGVCPHRSPMHVYAEKIGMGVPFEMNDAIEWGNRLEPVIAQKYADDHGLVNVCPLAGDPSMSNPQQTFRHSEYPWMLATPDRLVLGDVGQTQYGVEIKSAGFRQYDRWGDTADKLPPEYYVQVSWCMAVLDVPRWDMAVLIGGQDYREYVIERDPAFEMLLISKAKDLWENHILKRVPPTPDAMAATRRALAAIYPSNGGEWKGSNREIDVLATDYEKARAALREAETRKAELENALRNHIGDAEGIIGDWGKASWRANKNGARCFRVKFAKEG